MNKESRTLHVERSTSTAHRLKHYDGVCGNIHGHNMDWEAEVTVSMEDVGDDNMPLDLKDVADVIDEVDHAAILSEQEKDAIADEIETMTGANPSLSDIQIFVERVFGDVLWFDGDPTCEVMAKWMAKRIYDSNSAIEFVRIKVAETDKYAIESSYGEYEAMKEAAENDE